MNDVKIDIDEVNRIITRIDEISTQLEDALKSNVDCFSNLCNHDIKSSAVTDILTKYNENAEILRKQIIRHLAQCKSYLQGKVRSYTNIDSAAQESAKKIDSFLSGIDIG